MEIEYINYIAKEIVEVLSCNQPYVMSWGVETIKATSFKNMAGVRFNVNGFLHKGDVVVAYNEGVDLYEVYCLDNKGEVVNSSEDVYFDVLTDTIDKMVETKHIDDGYHAKIDQWLNEQTEQQ